MRCDSRSFHISRSTFERWFPALALLMYWQPFFDADALAHQVRFGLGNYPSVPIRMDHIYDALRDVFDELSGYESGYWDSKEGRIKEMLENFMRDERSGRDLDGLYKTRNRFMILCVVAQCSRSERFAGELAGFIEDKARRIVESEERYLLHEWCLGVNTLLGLLSPWKKQSLINKLSDVSSGSIGDWDFVPYHVHVPRIHYYPQRYIPRPYLPAPAPRLWYPSMYRVPVPGRRRSWDRVPTPWSYPEISHYTPRMLGTSFSDAMGALQMGNVRTAMQLADLGQRVDTLHVPHITSGYSGDAGEVQMNNVRNAMKVADLKQSLNAMGG